MGETCSAWRGEQELGKEAAPLLMLHWDLCLGGFFLYYSEFN